jgi:hypothetical protein
MKFACLFCLFELVRIIGEMTMREESDTRPCKRLRNSVRKRLAPAFVGMCGLAVVSSGAQAMSILIDFNDPSTLGTTLNAAGSDLIATGPGSFSITFTDDKSGSANGVHVTNQNPGNVKVGSGSDFVLGATDGFHSSGIVAQFSQGVTSVSFFDSDDDLTGKTLFAFDQFGSLIGQDGNGP